MSRKIEDIAVLHGIVLDMLKALDAFCRENQITYFLSGGTAIGAVRDHGFIAWDDDADVMMPRRDYERFLALWANEKNPRYCVDSIHTRADWTLPFARIWDRQTRVVYHNLAEAETGMFIDIYPMDGLPDSLRATKLHYARVRLLNVCLFASIRKRFKPDEKFIFPKKILAVIAHKIGSRRICARIDRIAAKRDFDSANYVGCAVLSHYMARERFPRSAFTGMNYVPFEDTRLPVPNGYDAYLSALYGNYMAPPPPAARESEHHMDILTAD